MMSFRNITCPIDGITANSNRMDKAAHFISKRYYKIAHFVKLHKIPEVVVNALVNNKYLT